MQFIRVTSAVFVCLGVSACATVPSLPPKAQLPIADIVHHAECELKEAVRTHANEYPWFKDKDWAASISLTPKIDLEYNVRTSTSFRFLSPKDLHYASYLLGSSSPGAEYDGKGERTSIMTFDFKLSQLMNSTIDCETILFRGQTDPVHNLSRNLGVGDWFERVLETSRVGVAKPSKLTYSSEVIVKYDANATPSYFWTRGTANVGLTGTYTDDELLSILMTYDPPKIDVIKTTTTKTVQLPVKPKGADNLLEKVLPGSRSKSVQTTTTTTTESLGVTPQGRQSIELLQLQQLFLSNGIRP